MFNLLLGTGWLLRAVSRSSPGRFPEKVAHPPDRLLNRFTETGTNVRQDLVNGFGVITVIDNLRFSGGIMAATSFRSIRRYAVRPMVRIVRRSASDISDSAEGLLIELSVRGCRISNINRETFSTGDAVTLEIEEVIAIRSSVRLAENGIVCLNFTSPLYSPALDRLIAQCRPTDTIEVVQTPPRSLRA